MKLKTIPYSILLTFSILVYGLWRSDSPMPSVLNWDIFEHQTVVNRILAGRWALLPSSLTDTFRFDGYTTAFHTAIAALQSLTHADPLSFWWVAEGIHLILVTFLSYGLTLVFTKNRWAAFLGGIIGATVFESHVAYSSLFLLPQTASAVWGIAALAILNSNATSQTKRMAVFLGLLASVLFHFIIGGYILFLAGVWWATHNTTKHQMLKFATSMALLIPTISYMLKTSTALEAINYGEAAAFSQSAGEKLRFLYQWYGGTIVLIPISIIMTLFSNKKHLRMLGLMALLAVITIFSPLPYVLKFAVAGRYFINAAICLPFVWIITRLISLKHRLVTTTVISTMYLFIFISNVQIWKAPIYSDGIASEVSTEERAASEYLKFHYDANTMLVSDPTTQYVLEAVSGINSQGGAYASDQTRISVAKLMDSQTKKELLRYLEDMQDNLDTSRPTRILFVASGRYFRWLDQPDKLLMLSHNIWRPESLTLTDHTILQSFETKTELIPVYRSKDMVIYDIPQKGASI